MVEGLRERDPGIQISVLSANPSLTKKLYAVHSIHRYDFSKIIGELLRTDVFISGGGTLFQNTTSNRSFLYYIGLVWLAKILRKKVMIFAQGFGPLSGKTNRFLARFILNRVDLITLRDKYSLSSIKALGVTKPAVKLTADPAFCLKFASLKNTRPLLGIVLRELPRKEDYQILAKAIDWVVQTYKYSPIFLLFHPSKDKDTAVALSDLMREELEIIDEDSDPKKMLAAISQLDLLIGMRLHSLIFAAMCNVPMLGLSYDPKVEAFIKEIGQPSLRVGANLDLNRFKNLLERISTNKKSIKNSLEIKGKELREKAKQNFTLFFNQ